MTDPADAPLIAAYGSLRSGSFRDRVRAARDAGFDGFGVHVRDHEALRAEGWTDADLATLLHDHGFDLIEIETVLGWDDAPYDVPGERERLAYALADAVGARHVVAVAALEGELRPGAAEGFAALCDRAAEHGLLVALEPQACSSVVDLEAALAITRAAARPNGGLNLDLWHATRSGWVGDVAALDPAEIVVAQIDDGPLVPRTDDYLEECTHYRALPGEGEFDLTGFLAAVFGTGTTAPVSVEVISDDLAALPLPEAARRLARTSRAALAAAGTFAGRVG